MYLLGTATSCIILPPLKISVGCGPAPRAGAPPTLPRRKADMKWMKNERFSLIRRKKVLIKKNFEPNFVTCYFPHF